jgi:hypothetical protein
VQLPGVDTEAGVFVAKIVVPPRVVDPVTVFSPVASAMNQPLLSLSAWLMVSSVACDALGSCSVLLVRSTRSVSVIGVAGSAVIACESLIM